MHFHGIPIEDNGHQIGHGGQGDGKDVGLSGGAGAKKFGTGVNRAVHQEDNGRLVQPGTGDDARVGSALFFQCRAGQTQTGEILAHRIFRQRDGNGGVDIPGEGLGGDLRAIFQEADLVQLRGVAGDAPFGGIESAAAGQLEGCGVYLAVHILIEHRGAQGIGQRGGGQRGIGGINDGQLPRAPRVQRQNTVLQRAIGDGHSRLTIEVGVGILNGDRVTDFGLVAGQVTDAQGEVPGSGPPGAVDGNGDTPCVCGCLRKGLSLDLAVAVGAVEDISAQILLGIGAPAEIQCAVKELTGKSGGNVWRLGIRGSAHVDDLRGGHRDIHRTVGSSKAIGYVHLTAGIGSAEGEGGGHIGAAVKAVAAAVAHGDGGDGVQGVEHILGGSLFKDHDILIHTGHTELVLQGKAAAVVDVQLAVHGLSGSINVLGLARLPADEGQLPLPVRGGQIAQIQKADRAGGVENLGIQAEDAGEGGHAELGDVEAAAAEVRDLHQRFADSQVGILEGTGAALHGAFSQREGQLVGAACGGEIQCYGGLGFGDEAGHIGGERDEVPGAGEVRAAAIGGNGEVLPVQGVDAAGVVLIDHGIVAGCNIKGVVGVDGAVHRSVELHFVHPDLFQQIEIAGGILLLFRFRAGRELPDEGWDRIAVLTQAQLQRAGGSRAAHQVGIVSADHAGVIPAHGVRIVSANDAGKISASPDIAVVVRVGEILLGQDPLGRDALGKEVRVNVQRGVVPVQRHGPGLNHDGIIADGGIDAVVEHLVQIVLQLNGSHIARLLFHMGIHIGVKVTIVSGLALHHGVLAGVGELGPDAFQIGGGDQIVSVFRHDSVKVLILHHGVMAVAVSEDLVGGFVRDALPHDVDVGPLDQLGKAAVGVIDLNDQIFAREGIRVVGRGPQSGGLCRDDREQRQEHTEGNQPARRLLSTGA